MRAQSPAVVIRTKKASKKNYSDESDSDTHSKKRSSKKRYENSSESDSEPKSKKKSSKKHSDSDDSDSDPRSKRRSSRKHHDESDSDDKSKKKSKKRYSDSDSDSRSRKKASKKHYNKSDSSSSSSEDDRKNRHKHSKKVALSRNGEYIETSTSRYERERHGSYASPEHHERPVESKRHMSTSSAESGEKHSQLSMPGGFNGGHSPHPQYTLPRPLAYSVSN